MTQNRDILLIFAPLSSTLLMIFAHWFLVLFFKLSVIRSLFIALFSGLGFLVCFTLITGCQVDLISHLPLYCGLWYGYFHFINIGEASIRLRILDILKKNEGRPVSREKIYSLYNAEEIIRLRLERMTLSGQINLINGRYYLGRRRLILVIGIFQLIQRVVMGTKVSGSSLEKGQELV